MRHTQPLTAEEQRVDTAMRTQGRTHAEQDAALTMYRMAQRAEQGVRAERLERVADLLTGGDAVILLPFLLWPLVAWVNSPHLWVMYAFAHLWWARNCGRWVRRV